MNAAEQKRRNRERPLYEAQKLAESFGYIAPIVQGPEALEMTLWYNGERIAMCQYRANVGLTMGRIFSKDATVRTYTGGPSALVTLAGRPPRP